MNKYLFIILTGIILIFYSCESLLDTKSDYKLEKINDVFNFSTTNDVEVFIETKDGNNNLVQNVNFKIFYENKIISAGSTFENGVYQSKIAIPTFVDSVTVRTNNLFYYGDVKVPVINNQINYSYDNFGQTSKSLTLQKYNVVDCSECDGHVTDLTMMYTGEYTAIIKVKQGHKVVFEEKLEPFEEFSISGTDREGTFGPEIKLYVDNVENTKIHTSCSDPIGPGLISGDFEVISGQSRHGGDLCAVINSDCEECDGKVTDLTMLYIGDEYATIKVEQKRHKVVFENDVESYGEFSFNGTERDGTLGTEIILFVNGIKNTKIHTSCSNPIGPGLISGDFKIISGQSLRGGALCPVDGYEEDGDNDGIIDSDDNYPEDPDKAFNNNTDGTLAYEDLWPVKGDYDFNDLVIDYEINQITNAANRITQIKIALDVKAAGAAYQNAFGIEIPGLLPSNVANVYGDFKHETTLPNIGTSNDGNFVIIPFDHTRHLFESQSIYINTRYYPAVSTEVMNFTINLSAPIRMNELYTPPYNPFIIIHSEPNGDEVHLIGMNSVFYETNGENPYKDENGMPWAINIPTQFDYPIEDEDIQNVFYHFNEWINSNGESYPDWYINNSGYRNVEITYTTGD